MHFILLCVINFGYLFSLLADEYEGVEYYSNKKFGLFNMKPLLPYNPIILEAGAYQGATTLHAATFWPKARVIAFEPSPDPRIRLEREINIEGLSNVQVYPLALNTYNGVAPLYICRGRHGFDPSFECFSSLLPESIKEDPPCCRGPQIEVPCVILDDWCVSNQIDHIDLLWLELEGLELRVLQSSPDILKTIKVLYVQTLIDPYRSGMTTYNELKKFLEENDFVLVSHWYNPWIEGHAAFLSRELFDAYFKQSVGIYLDR